MILSLANQRDERENFSTKVEKLKYLIKIFTIAAKNVGKKNRKTEKNSFRSERPITFCQMFEFLVRLFVDEYCFLEACNVEEEYSLVLPPSCPS